MKLLLSEKRVKTLKGLSFSCSFCYFLLIFSPLLSFLNSLILLIVYREKVQDILAPCIVVSLSIVASSRKIYETFKDDFETYYENFYRIVNDKDGALFDFGIELGLPLVNWLLGMIFGELPPRFYLLLIVLVQFSVLYFALKRIFPQKTYLSLLFCFSLLPLLGPTLFIRQFFSIVFLLFLLDKNKRIRWGLGVFMASIFHLAAIPLIALFFFIKYRLTKWSDGKLLLFITLAVCSLVFSYQFFSSVPKVRAWFILTGEFELATFISNYKVIGILALLTLAIPDKNKEIKIFLRTVFLVLFSALVFDFILPHISFRVFLFPVVFAGLGFYFLFLNSSNRSIKLTTLSVFVFLVLARWASVALSAENYEFVLFDSQKVIGLEPLHYINAYYDHSYNKYRKEL